MRLSERNGDVGSGVLEVFRMNKRQWMPACVKNWDRAVSPSAVCSILGYSAVNATSVVTQRTHRPLLASVNVSTDIWKLYAKRRSTLMQEFANCRQTEDYPIAELTCSNFGGLSKGVAPNPELNPFLFFVQSAARSSADVTSPLDASLAAPRRIPAIGLSWLPS